MFREPIALSIVALLLCGCLTAQEQQAEQARKIDAQDDAHCRQQVAPASSSDPAYGECRQRLAQIRQAAIQNDMATAQALQGLGTSMQQAGAWLQAASPPPPITCTTRPAPFPGGMSTTTCN